MKHPFQDIYDKVPKLECKGLCGTNRHDTCCGPIACTNVEAQLMDEYNAQPSVWNNSSTGREWVIMARESLQAGHICPHLTLNGRCAVYDVRPLICRLWGVSEALKCPWGCKPKEYVSLLRGNDLLMEAERRSSKIYEDVAGKPKV